MRNNIQTHRSGSSLLPCFVSCVETFTVFSTISFFKKVLLHNNVIKIKKEMCQFNFVLTVSKGDNVANLTWTDLSLLTSTVLTILSFKEGDDVPVPARFLSHQCYHGYLERFHEAMVRKEKKNTRAEVSGDRVCGKGKKKKLLLVFTQIKLSVEVASALCQVSVSITRSLLST